MNVALYGYGRWGANVARCMREAGKSVHVLDVSGNAVGRARHAGYTATHLALPATTLVAPGESDAVAICTPPDTHGNLVRQALEAGKHVWCEKPIAEDAAATAFLIALAHEANPRRVLFVDHTFTFAPAVHVLAAAIVPRGVRHVEAVRTHLCPLREGTDILGDLLPHDVSILHACGLRVQAIEANLRPHEAALAVRFGGGATGSIFLSWDAALKQRRMVLYGRRRTIVYDHLDPREPVRIYDPGSGEETAWSQADARSPAVFAGEPLAAAVEAFQRACAGGPDNADAALEVQRVVDAARRSAREGRWIEVER